MKRARQSVDELLCLLSAVDTSWEDAHSRAVVALLQRFPDSAPMGAESLRALLSDDFEVGLTAVRLVVDCSKDEFQLLLRAELGPGGIGVKRFRREPEEFIQALARVGALQKFQELSHRPVTWRDLLVERLKQGRGSALKGQYRGRFLEDFTESYVRGIFGEKAYDVRCRFIGAKGESTEKADFAIPAKEDPRILIETKAYGATGSKQTDILGDVRRIVAEKRHDTTLLLVTDGVTWKARVNDLRKLVQLQNEGSIARIYTQKMADDLEADLRQLKVEHGL